MSNVIDFPDRKTQVAAAAIKTHCRDTGALIELETGSPEYEALAADPQIVMVDPVWLHATFVQLRPDVCDKLASHAISVSMQQLGRVTDGAVLSVTYLVLRQAEAAGDLELWLMPKVAP